MRAIPIPTAEMKAKRGEAAMERWAHEIAADRRRDEAQGLVEAIGVSLCSVRVRATLGSGRSSHRTRPAPPYGR